jgi:hypothetical protein
MHIARQPVVEVVGDTLALVTRRERGAWSLHDTNAYSLAIARGRFKADTRRDGAGALRPFVGQASRLPFFETMAGGAPAPR